MLKRTKISEVPVGTTIEIWGHKYTILDKKNNGVFCLEEKAVAKMVFRKSIDNHELGINDFRSSDIRRFLNDKYINDIRIQQALDKDILPFDVDLKCTMGQHEYGKDTVMVGLLTLEEYGEYYDLIPKTDSGWWLATPWKTPKYSLHPNSSTYVCRVYSNGSVLHNRCSYSYGVRPTLTLSSELLVFCEEQDKQE